MAYILGTLLSVTLAALPESGLLRGQGDSRKKRALCCFLAALPLFVLSALRWDVGTDTWHTYTPEYLAMMSETRELSPEEEQIILNDYRRLAKRDFGYTDEQISAITYKDAFGFFSQTYKHTSPGFQLIERGLIALNADVQWLYVVTSLIIMAFVFASIYWQSKDSALACLLFVITSNYFLALNIVSQYMAISICLFACMYVEKQKPLPFFLLVLLAASFHTSALVFLPVYFLPKLRVKPLWCAVSVAAVFLLVPLLFPLLEKLVRLVMPKYARYFAKNTVYEFEWFFFAIGAAVFALGTYYWEQGKDRPRYRLWYYANVLGLMALCFAARMPNMKRINYYFAAPHFLLLPLIIRCEADRRRRICLKIVVIVLFIAETVVAVWLLNKNQPLPYQTFWQARTPVESEALVGLAA